ncbi:MerR family transcriptional regulator [Dietzia sp. HMSC21D01]|uniref:MerR family transcriptional regulator n=1 Tax=Dietzia cinnamea TaxID=321318 RepID=A0AAW5Q2W5_9ACTN|nr:MULTISPECIES: MerR family transcriptional regulator [Dietzia]MCT1638717.1 MerR family transcriptional regulator [Dietzia cinnamea]MCT1862741.1 MerR family transcriptional regulator [Dietzia cinnamea]MCT2029749.1 MerR family transcriptional regulator [Dietzia cinnamea]MCT2032018.1 MerR family transcriptional regulator [Dietzia cinnamea]MCT2057266.1 MerR family transcriptional regulator [Dietzia cinnamea]
MKTPEAGPLQRIEELAEDSGTTVRNIRVYQERGLLPPPVRRGRTAFYGPDHKRRLAQILRLLDRGYTFATIEELFIAERHGFTLTELLELEAVRPTRRSTGGRRRLPRGGVDAVAGFELPEHLLDRGESIGLASDSAAADHFFADRYMLEMFRELIVLGVGEEGIDKIGHLFMEGQSTAAEAIDVLVQTMKDAGMDQSTIIRRVTGILPRAGAAARLIFLSAAQTLLTDRHGFPKS